MSPDKQRQLEDIEKAADRLTSLTDVVILQADTAGNPASYRLREMQQSIEDLACACKFVLGAIDR